MNKKKVAKISREGVFSSLLRTQREIRLTIFFEVSHIFTTTLFFFRKNVTQMKERVITILHTTTMSSLTVSNFFLLKPQMNTIYFLLVI